MPNQNMIEICAIASGSNGNCYYAGNATDAILIDAGISRKQILLRMSQKKLNPAKVRAIFISHEHSDHFRGVRVLSKKMGIPVYITSQTLERSWHPHRPALVKHFIPGDTIRIGGLAVHTFGKSHDAVDPCSFRVEYNGINVGVFTDIGVACNNVKEHLSRCQALFLESNYDEDMLWAGSYPYHLKKRIASVHGHLSNIQALELLKEYRHPELQVVFLSHLSAENNRPDIALSVFEELSGMFAIKVTNRYAISDVFSFSV
jgi:phosphoribosyl 1,2-cyclic phosphodiesterase